MQDWDFVCEDPPFVFTILSSLSGLKIVLDPYFTHSKYSQASEQHVINGQGKLQFLLPLKSLSLSTEHPLIFSCISFAASKIVGNFITCFQSK